MTIDLVYPVRSGDNEELRYSLRSAARLAHQVWLIGDPPPWAVANVLRDQHRDRPGRMTHQHLMTAVGCPAISDPFIWMNDDFYAMPHAHAFPDWHRGRVDRLAQDLIRHHGHGRAGQYVAGMLQVRDALVRTEDLRDPLSFEYHAPLIVYKDVMRYALLHAVTHKRTYYGNLARREGLLDPVEHADVLVLGRGDVDPAWEWAATTDASWRRSEAGETIRAAYPDPSIYEEPSHDPDS